MAFGLAVSRHPKGQRPRDIGIVVSTVMLVISLLTLLIAIPLSSSNISPVQLTRATSITLFFAAALSFNAYNVTTIGSGVSLYSGLFHVSTVSMAMELFIFTIGGLILLP